MSLPGIKHPGLYGLLSVTYLSSDSVNPHACIQTLALALAPKPQTVPARAHTATFMSVIFCRAFMLNERQASSVRLSSRTYSLTVGFHRLSLRRSMNNTLPPCSAY